MAPGSGTAGPSSTPSIGRYARSGCRCTHSRTRPNPSSPPAAISRIEPSRPSSNASGRRRSPVHHRDRHAPVVDDGGEPHRSGARRGVGEQRRDRRAHDVGHAAHAGPALERDGGLLDQHLRPVRRSQAARPRRPQQRRLGRHVDQVEDGRPRSAASLTSIVAPGSSMPTVVALTARSADRSAAENAAPSSAHRRGEPGPNRRSVPRAAWRTPPCDSRRSPAARRLEDRRTRPRGRRRRPRRRRRRPPRAAGPSRARHRPGSRGRPC